MHLNEMELAVLDCVLRGLVRSEIIAELGIGRGSICYRKRQIRSNIRHISVLSNDGETYFFLFTKTIK